GLSEVGNSPLLSSPSDLRIFRTRLLHRLCKFFPLRIVGDGTEILRTIGFCARTSGSFHRKALAGFQVSAFDAGGGASRSRRQVRDFYRLSQTRMVVIPIGAGLRLFSLGKYHLLSFVPVSVEHLGKFISPRTFPPGQVQMMS